MEQAIQALRALASEHDASAVATADRRRAVMLEFLDFPALDGFDFERVWALYLRQARRMARAH